MSRTAQPNQTLQATPVDGFIEVLSRGFGVPDLHRSMTATDNAPSRSAPLPAALGAVVAAPDSRGAGTGCGKRDREPLDPPQTDVGSGPVHVDCSNRKRRSGGVAWRM